MPIAAAARALGARLRLPDLDPDPDPDPDLGRRGTSGAEATQFHGVSTDSRAELAGRLFVALRGERFDGHDYVNGAFEQGAAAAMICDSRAYRGPTLEVADTGDALVELARQWRARFDLPVTVVTGSNGKTTVKEMLAAMGCGEGEILATRGNLNNHIGLPLMLLELQARHRAAVIELGANHAGEVARLTAVADPTVGVITQCAPAHLAGFGSIEGVARAKGELFVNMGAGATAVINADDPFAPMWGDLGHQPESEYRARRRELTPHGGERIIRIDHRGRSGAHVG